jgi:hypothetical protein
MSTTDLIPPGSKFSCVALRGASIDELGDAPIRLEVCIWAAPWVPFELEDVWKEWIGSLQSKELLGANLWILAVAPSANPGVLDEENEVLRATAERVFFGLVLQGMRYDRGYVLSGAHHEESVDVRQFSTLRDYHPNIERDSRLITIDLLRKAALDSKRIEEIYHPVVGLSGGRPESQIYRRLRRGFYALLRGYEEQWWDTRLHQFVRAIEALLLLPIGKSRREFTSRCGTFLGASAETQQLLSEMYQLRSCAEHMNPMETVLRGPDPLRIALKRSMQSELVASEIYLRLFRSPEFLHRFSDDDAISAFWNERDHSVRAVWGSPFDLTAAMGALYRPINGLDS